MLLYFIIMAKDEDEAEAVEYMKAALARARGYADFFGWPDREIAELGVIESLAESLDIDSALFFTSARSRGQGNDPPDCEALTTEGARLALEVTELVSAEAICGSKKTGDAFAWQQWDEPGFLAVMTAALEGKDDKYPKLRGGPYPGGYVVVIHADEPLLSRAIVEPAVCRHEFNVAHISRAFLLLSYDPKIERCPYFELALSRAPPAAHGSSE